MRPVDDRILESLRETGNLTPRALEDFGITSKSHASDRLSKMAKYGLVERISRGLYGLTDTGREFLNEEIDGDELEPVDES
jgi:hypothetical protein